MTPRMQEVLKAVTRHTLARKTEDASWHGLLWFRGVRLDVLDVRLDNEVRRQINEGAS